MKYNMAIALVVLLAVGRAFGDDAENAVAVETLRHRLLVPVMVNGEGPYSFVLDTVTVTPVIDSEVADDLKLEALPGSAVEMPSADGDWVKAHAVRAAFRVGDRELESSLAVVASLEPLERWLGGGVDGLINISHLGPLITIDFAGHSIRWPNAIPDVGEPVTIAELDGGIHAKVLINGKAASDAVLDLGFGGLCAVPESWARAMDLLSISARRLDLEWGDAAPPLAPTGQLQAESLRLGPLEFNGVLVDLSETGAYPRIGAEAFAGCVTVWDFRRGGLYINDDDKKDTEPSGIAGYGLTLGLRGDRAWRVGVAMPSPASRAGVRGGDYVLEVDGQSLAGKGYAETWSALSASGPDERTFVFSRDGEAFTVQLSPEPLL